MKKLVSYSLSKTELSNLVYEYMRSKKIEPTEVIINAKEEVGTPFCRAYLEAEDVSTNEAKELAY